MSPTRSSAAVGALVALLTAMALVLALPAAGTAASDDECGASNAVSNAAGECEGTAEPVPSLDPEWSASFKLPKQPRAAAQSVLLCRPVNVVIYSPTDWLRIAQKFAANASPCAQYYIDIPPLAADKKSPRLQQPALIHALGPQFHVMYEFNLNGWRPWVDGGSGTWYDAGVEWRLRIIPADFREGDIWALNELGDATRTHTGPQRENMENAVRGLYDGPAGSPAVKGLVWTSGIGQSTTNLGPYKQNLEDWYADDVFWSTMDKYVRFFSQEVYGDVRRWAVPGTDAASRRDRLVEYLEHTSVLSNVSPPDIAVQKDLLRATDAPTGNAAWSFTSGFGWTAVPYTTMRAYVASQTYAFRRHQALASWRADDSFGFAWSPNSTPAGMSNTDYVAQSALILDQLAASIHASDVVDADPGLAACGPDGSWCAADLDGATFNLVWQTFGIWTQAYDSEVTLAEDMPTEIPLPAFNPDAAPFTYQVVTQPQHGTVAGDGASRTYTPDENYNGDDSFQFVVSDGVMATRPATVEIHITPVNDAPTVALDQPSAIDEGAPAQTLVSHAADVDGDTLTYGWIVTHPGDILSFGPTAELTADDGPSVVHVNVFVDDGQGGSATTGADVTVNNVAPVPEAGADLTAMWRIPALLIGSGSDPSTADAASLSPSWDFGDGDPAAPAISVEHAWNEPGTYRATLSVWDKDGAGVFDRTTVTVVRRPARLVYAGPQTATAPWATLYARISDLADRHTERLGGHRLTIAIGSRSCTASSNSGGLAMCAINITGLPPRQTPVTVTFAGDELYTPASGASTILLQ
jgi:hypothetical protein